MKLHFVASKLKKPSGRIVTVIGCGVLLALMLAGTWYAQSGKDLPQGGVTFTNDAQPIMYANNTMIDACALIPLHVLQVHINKYSESLSSLGSRQPIHSPLLMRHNYYDTAATQVTAATVPSSALREGNGEKVSPSLLFNSPLNSQCDYGQGKNFETTFATVIVVQPPTSLPPQLEGYIIALKEKGRLAKDADGLQLYAQPREDDGNYTFVIKKADTVVVLRSPIQNLVQAAGDEIVAKLTQSPTGSLQVRYPAPYERLANPCSLFTPADFLSVVSTPAIPLASEELYLTEVAPGTAQRSCVRQNATSSLGVAVRQYRDAASAQASLQLLKNGGPFVANALISSSDESYFIRTNPGGGQQKAGVTVRLEATVIEVTFQVNGAASEDMQQRLIAVAESIRARFSEIKS